MKITKEKNENFIYSLDATSSGEVIRICTTLKKKYGATEFNFKNGKWRFNDIGLVDYLVKAISNITVHYSMYEDVKKKEEDIKKKNSKINRSLDIKNKKETTFKINNLKQDLYPYQKIGVEFLVNNHGRGLLTDEMGLGKTAQALAYIAHTEKKRALIICPASVKFSWKNEAEKWTHLKAGVLGSKDFAKFKKGKFDDCQIIIINYDIVKKFLPLFVDIPWDCMVADECHMIKNINTIRTKAVKLLSKKIPSIIMISGTPFLNRPVELFNSLHIVNPADWPNWFAFTKRYCGGHYSRFGWDSSGATHIEELRKKISHYFIRRKKEEVLKELPPKTYIDCPLELPNDVSKKYKMAEMDFISYLQQVKNKKVLGTTDGDEQAYKLAKLNELKMLSSEGKVKYAKEFIQNIISSGEKVVVFSTYHQPLKDIKEEFKDMSVMITGETKIKDREHAVEVFQKDDNIKIFLGGMKSAGVGITLTAASKVLFVDYSWVPADHAQAADRTHRIGQKADSISIYQLHSIGTVDEYIKKILEKKKAIFAKLIDGEMLPKDKKMNVMNDVLKVYEKQLST